MKKLIQTFVDLYVLVKVAPMAIKGAMILIQASRNGLDESLELLNLTIKQKREKKEEV